MNPFLSRTIRLMNGDQYSYVVILFCSFSFVLKKEKKKNNPKENTNDPIWVSDIALNAPRQRLRFQPQIIDPVLVGM